MTKQEAYQKIAASKELHERFVGTKDSDALRAFLSELGYDGDASEFIAYVKSLYEGEIDDAIAEDIAGGKPRYPIL